MVWGTGSSLPAGANLLPTEPPPPEVAIVLYQDGDETVLSAERSRAVIAHFDVVRQEAARWRQMTGKQGRLLIIDSTLISEITSFLASA